MKHLLITASVIFLFTACETGYRGDCNATIESKPHNTEGEREKPRYIEPALASETFRGGTEMEGLAVGSIRSSQKSDGVRIVLDSYEWDAVQQETIGEAGSVGQFRFVYDPDRALIMGALEGYENLTTNMPSFSQESLVEKVYPNAVGDRVYIKLREEAKVRVFALENPGRIVIDIKYF